MEIGSKIAATFCRFVLPYLCVRYLQKAAQFSSVGSPNKNSSTAGSSSTGNRDSINANFSTGDVIPERMYADSTRRIHFSIEFLSKGGSSGFRLDTCRPERAVVRVLRGSVAAISSCCCASGGRELVSGDGKKDWTLVVGCGIGDGFGDGDGDRDCLALAPHK